MPDNQVETTVGRNRKGEKRRESRSVTLDPGTWEALEEAKDRYASDSVAEILEQAALIGLAEIHRNNQLLFVKVAALQDRVSPVTEEEKP